MGYRSLLLLVCLTYLMTLGGCSGTIPSSHGYVLARSTPQGIVAIADDSPLYESVEREIMLDPVIQHLLSLFEGTCGGFAATNLVSPNPNTLRNRLVVVIGDDADQLLQDVSIRYGSQSAQVEYAISLALDDEDHLNPARRRLSGLLAQFLLAVTGQDPPADVTSMSSDTDCVSGETAFWQGYAILLQERHAIGLGPIAAWNIETAAMAPAPDADRLACETNQQTKGEPAPCTCGQRVAAFLSELLLSMPTSYPQRYMLWFANYGPGELRDAKLLLAFARIPHGQAITLQSFLASYTDTFPAETKGTQALLRDWQERTARQEP